MATHHLFISHSWNYSSQYFNLVGLLEKYAETHQFDFVNYSVPKNDPVHTNGTDRELRAKIKNHMRPAQVVIILAGVYSSYSKWIKKEIDIAKNDFSKPILAVEPWGSERTSTLVKDSADKIVKWNTVSIVKAIRQLS